MDRERRRLEELRDEVSLLRSMVSQLQSKLNEERYTSERLANQLRGECDKLRNDNDKLKRELARK